MVQNNSHRPGDSMESATAAIRAGEPRSEQGEHSEALYLTSSFVFSSAAEAAAKFSGEQTGNVYSRYTNPTVSTFERRLALMEETESAVGTASGMSAILSTCMALLRAGDHIVASRNIFGSTTTLFSKYMGRFGVSVTYVDLTDIDQWHGAMTDRTRLLFAETPSNPLNEVGDIGALANVAHAGAAFLVIDNCFCTPALQKPAVLGADLVIHSATKFIDGQGRAMGGAVCGPKQMIDEIVGFLRSAGPTMSPFNAWVFLKGLETLHVRMKAHSDNALELATWLKSQQCVARVYYCGLPEHPGYKLAQAQQSGFGAVLAFEVNGGREAAWQLIDQTRLLSITANLGDTKTTITHPATTTHGRLTDEDKVRSGITAGLIRLSVGLEAVSDLKADLVRGLKTL